MSCYLDFGDEGGIGGEFLSDAVSSSFLLLLAVMMQVIFIASEMRSSVEKAFGLDGVYGVARKGELMVEEEDVEVRCNDGELWW